MARVKKRALSSGATNKKMPLNQSIPLGIQHVFAMRSNGAIEFVCTNI